MQFPAHPEGAGFDHHVRIGAVDSGTDVRLAQLGEMGAGGRRLLGAVLEHQMGDQHRTEQRNRRPGVEFIVEALAERVFLQVGQTWMHRLWAEGASSD